MDPPTRVRTAPAAWRLLAGLETGIWGGVAMMVWIGLNTALARRSFWTVPNLLSTALSRSPARAGFSAETLPGLALHLFTAALIGMLFGILARAPWRKSRTRLLALLAGLIWYYFSKDLFWSRVGPAITVYVSPFALLSGHLVFGAVLGWYPRRLESLKRHARGEHPEGFDSSVSSLEP
jgi:hypothetical protein